MKARPEVKLRDWARLHQIASGGAAEEPMGDMAVQYSPYMAMAVASGRLVDESQAGLVRARGNEHIEGPCLRNAGSRGAMVACEREVDSTKREGPGTDNGENPRVPRDILSVGASHEDHSGHRSSGCQSVPRGRRSGLQDVHRSGLRRAHRRGPWRVHTPDTLFRQCLCCTPGTALIFRVPLTVRCWTRGRKRLLVDQQSACHLTIFRCLIAL